MKQFIFFLQRRDELDFSSHSAGRGRTLLVDDIKELLAPAFEYLKEVFRFFPKLVSHQHLYFFTAIFTVIFFATFIAISFGGLWLGYDIRQEVYDIKKKPVKAVFLLVFIIFLSFLYVFFFYLVTFLLNKTLPVDLLELRKVLFHKIWPN